MPLMLAQIGLSLGGDTSEEACTWVDGLPQRVESPAGLYPGVWRTRFLGAHLTPCVLNRSWANIGPLIALHLSDPVHPVSIGIARLVGGDLPPRFTNPVL